MAAGFAAFVGDKHRFKTTDEGVAVVCEIMEKYGAKREAMGEQRGEERGEKMAG